MPGGSAAAGADDSTELGEWHVRHTADLSAESPDAMDRHDDLVEKDLDESMGGEFAGDAAAATAVAGTPLIADQNLHYGSVVRPERQGRGGADATAPTAAATAGGGLAGLPRPTAHGRTSATSAAVGSSSATWAHTPAGWGGDDAPDGPATSEREGPAGNGLGFGGARATVAAGDLSSHRDPMDADDLSPPHRGTTDADDPVETEMDAADSVEETGDWRTREHIRRDGRGGELVPVGEDESGPVYRDHTFASLAPRSERPKLLLKVRGEHVVVASRQRDWRRPRPRCEAVPRNVPVDGLCTQIGMEPDELILAEGQSLRRCVQKGWLLKYSDDARWIKGWKRRYFRVVVHTSVELLNAEAAGRGAQLPRMDEQVTAAWLLYYEDQL